MNPNQPSAQDLTPDGIEPDDEQQDDSSPETVDRNDGRFPVVGIGASAGGLDAFRKLLSNLPTDTQPIRLGAQARLEHFYVQHGFVKTGVPAPAMC